MFQQKQGTITVVALASYILNLAVPSADVLVSRPAPQFCTKGFTAITKFETDEIRRCWNFHGNGTRFHPEQTTFASSIMIHFMQCCICWLYAFGRELFYLADGDIRPNKDAGVCIRSATNQLKIFVHAHYIPAFSSVWIYSDHHLIKVACWITV